MKRAWELVSVPSRGLSYLKKGHRTKQGRRDIVSVPSRGLSYLKKTKGLIGEITLDSFRPLTGTLLSKTYSLIFLFLSLICVSVPSRGLSYLKITCSKCFVSQLLVSVPSRGLSYLKPDNYFIITQGNTVSVPSRGLSYLKSSIILMSSMYIIVSVPSRGLSYLKPIRQFSLPKRLLPLVCVANDILMIKEFNVFI